MTAPARRATAPAAARSSTWPSSSRSCRCSAPQLTVFDQLGIITQRTGNRSENNAPRNTYLTADGDWVAISTSAQSIAERVMRLVGRDDLIDEPWFGDGHQRAKHADVLDDAVGGWILERDRDVVVEEFEKAEAALAVVNDMSRRASSTSSTTRSARSRPSRTTTSARSGCRTCSFRLSEQPGEIRHTGRGHGADTDEVLDELGYRRARSARRCARAGRSECARWRRSWHWLYVPAPRAGELLAKAAQVADGIVVDLEDAVAPAAAAGGPRAPGRGAAGVRRCGVRGGPGEPGRHRRTSPPTWRR